MNTTRPVITFVLEGRPSVLELVRMIDRLEVERIERMEAPQPPRPVDPPAREAQLP